MDKQSMMQGRNSMDQNEVVSAATNAAKVIEQALEELPLNDAWTRKERKIASGYSHVPDEAIELVLDFLSRNPGRFPGFDEAAARTALAYSTSMGSVADRADELSSRIRTSVRMQRMLPLAQVLSLYTSAKAMNRHDGSLTDFVAKLGALVRTTKPGKRTKGTAKGESAPAPSGGSSTAPANGAAPSVHADAVPPSPPR